MMQEQEPALDPVAIQTLRDLTEPGQPDVLQEVLQLFLSDAPVRLAAIAAACSASDGVALQRAAHALKGASATIGAKRLQQACREMEELAKRDDRRGWRAAVAAAEQAYADVASEIRGLTSDA